PPPPVAAPRRPVVRRYFDTEVTDEYEWLENAESPEVRAFTEADSARARRTLDALAERPLARARLTSILGAPAPDWSDARSVAAPRRPVVRRYFDTEVTDEYEWLENAESPEVRAFTEAESALARRTLDALAERPLVKARLTSILGATSPDWFDVRSVAGRVFA